MGARCRALWCPMQNARLLRNRAKRIQTEGFQSPLGALQKQSLADFMCVFSSPKPPNFLFFFDFVAAFLSRKRSAQTPPYIIHSTAHSFDPALSLASDRENEAEPPSPRRRPGLHPPKRCVFVTKCRFPVRQHRTGTRSVCKNKKADQVGHVQESVGIDSGVAGL